MTLIETLFLHQNNTSVVREFTVINVDGISTSNENTVNFQTIERCINKSIDREKGNIVDTIEDRIQYAILTAINIFITRRIELVVRPINASSGRDIPSVTANSAREERLGITASFEN